jgi:hypothetical protein
MADIESMFHQVRTPLEDCDVLRFLWWPNDDTSINPEEFQMTVYLFGGISYSHLLEDEETGINLASKLYELLQKGGFR